MIESFVDAVGGKNGSALYGYLSAATHGQPFHLVKLGGERMQIEQVSLKDLSVQVLFAVQLMKVVHVRYAQYLGKESRARVRPYEEVIKALQKHSASMIEVGFL